MFIVSRPTANRVDLKISGALDSAEMEAGLQQFLTQSERVDGGRMLYTITSFAMPSLGALGVEMQYLPKLFGLMSRFEKCAVVADEAWLRTLAEVEGALVPGIEIKGFRLSEHDAAAAWLDA